MEEQSVCQHSVVAHFLAVDRGLVETETVEDNIGADIVLLVRTGVMAQTVEGSSCFDYLLPSFPRGGAGQSAGHSIEFRAVEQSFDDDQLHPRICAEEREQVEKHFDGYVQLHVRRYAETELAADYLLHDRDRLAGVLHFPIDLFLDSSAAQAYTFPLYPDGVLDWLVLICGNTTSLIDRELELTESDAAGFGEKTSSMG